MDKQKKLVENPYYHKSGMSNARKWFFIIRAVIFILFSTIALYFILLPNPTLYFSLASLFMGVVIWMMYTYVWKGKAMSKYLALSLIFAMSFMLIVTLFFELKNIF